MADKKVDATTGEVQTSFTEEEMAKLVKEKKLQYFESPKLDLDDDELKFQENHPIILTIHCKPVYNYQSVEFDIDIHNGLQEVDFAYMEDLYKGMLEMLVRVSQNAPQVEAKKPTAPVEELASEKQKEILRNFHIDFKPDITKKQAHALIKKSMDQEIF